MKKFYEEPEMEISEFSLTEDILGNSKEEGALVEATDEESGWDW